MPDDDHADRPVPHELLEARRRRAAESLGLTDEVLVVGAGSPVPVPGGMDQLLPFAPHPHYQWLAGHRSAGGVVAFDPKADEWRDFVPPTTEADRVWEGRADAPGEPIEGLMPWLTNRGASGDRPVVSLGVRPAGIESLDDDGQRAERAEHGLLAARRAKDEHELGTIRAACRATAEGFAAARDATARGDSERLIELALTTACQRAGGHGMGYHTIVGSGPNAAVLHFSAGSRAPREGEFVLIDAGCHIDGYTADVSRTFVKGTPTQQHRDLFAIVLEAERFALERCTAGQEFRELHLQAATRLAEGLVHLGILKGDPAGLVERDAHANFFPHGLGHLVGLGVRDASAYLPGRARSERFGLASLRMDLPLEPGFVTTVEPGLYFIEPLLRQAERRERFADCTDWDKVERWLHIGGVRIEDDVLVTDAEPVNLTEGIDKSFESMIVS
ncbi:MAG: M24 family metallopeptidase [Planctomycetota bacterium]